MTKADVVAIVGNPKSANTFPNLRQEVWDYSYMDYQTRMRAYVQFDINGVFVRHYELYDQWYYSDVGKN